MNIQNKCSHPHAVDGAISRPLTRCFGFSDGRNAAKRFAGMSGGPRFAKNQIIPFLCGVQFDNRCKIVKNNRLQVANSASCCDRGAASSPPTADANNISVALEVAFAQSFKKERRRPPKKKRMQGKSLAEWVFRTQNDTLQQKHRAAALLPNEIFEDPEMLHYASKIWWGMRSKWNTRIDKGGDPVLVAARLSLPGGEPLLDGNSRGDVYHEFINKLAFGMNDGDDDAVHHTRIVSFRSGQVSDVMFDYDAFETSDASGDDNANGDYWYPDMNEECGEQTNGCECWPDTDDGY